jgi:hypothetical protein
MTETVHDLPLVMRESSEYEEIFKVVGFVVNEVVANSDDPDQLEGSNCSK